MDINTSEILFIIRGIKDLTTICRGGEIFPLPGLLGLLDRSMKAVSSLIDYLGRGDKVEPVIRELRQVLLEFLGSGFVMAVEYNEHRWHLTESARENVRQCFDYESDPIFTVEWIARSCERWAHWIDLYFPPVEAAEHQEARPGAERPKSAAAVRLESQELQDIKKALIQAGIIAGDQWMGSSAEFGCLVTELFEQKGVTHQGGKAWKDCKAWAGYGGSVESARKAIDANPNTRGPIADKIRAICKAR